MVVLVVVGLLALGAIPATLQSGEPYRLTAEPVEDGPAYQIESDDLTKRRFEYTISAVERNGSSKPYYRGPFGLKESFTHSPFDEVETVRTFAPNATDGDAVFVRYDGTRYRVAVVGDTGDRS